MKRHQFTGHDLYELREKRRRGEKVPRHLWSATKTKPATDDYRELVVEWVCQRCGIVRRLKPGNRMIYFPGGYGVAPPCVAPDAEET